MPAQVAQVLFPVNVPEPFDYAVPPGMTLRVGEYVFAPLGSQMKLGVIWNTRRSDQTNNLKEIAEVKRTKPLSEFMIKFVDWTARYNCVSPGMVLRMIIRSYKALDPSQMATYYQPSGQLPPKICLLYPSPSPRDQRGSRMPSSA